MSLTVKAEGTTQVASHLDQTADRARDAKPAMRKIREIMEAGNRKQFETSGAYFGDSWAELKPGTLARKARRGQDARILRANNALSTSLSGGKGKRGGATKTQARAGTSVWWGIFAQTGTTGKRAAPRRQIVGLSRRDRLKSVRTIEKFVLTGEIFP